MSGAISLRPFTHIPSWHAQEEVHLLPCQIIIISIVIIDI
jgi:hypothetical protein